MTKQSLRSSAQCDRGFGSLSGTSFVSVGVLHFVTIKTLAWDDQPNWDTVKCLGISTILVTSFAWVTSRILITLVLGVSNVFTLLNI